MFGKPYLGVLTTLRGSKRMKRLFTICSGWWLGLSWPKSIDNRTDFEAKYQNLHSPWSTNETMIGHSTQIEQSKNVITHIIIFKFVEWMLATLRWKAC
jgi:hypothetical protein